MRAGRKQWIGLAVLVLPVLLISVDLHVLSYALPFISASLAPSGAQLLWIIDIYPFMLAGLLLPMGTLGDRVGRRRLLMAGAAAFGAASAVAAFSPSADLLIVTRALLGVGGATLMPSTLSLIRNMFHDDGQRRVAIAIWTGAFAGGAMLGPLMGGALLEHFWWGSVFLVNLPVMALLLVLAPLLPESRDPRPGRFDLLGVALSLGAILPTIYGIQHIAQDGLGWAPASAIVAGLTLGAAFVRRQRSMADPMLDVRLFGSRAFTVSIGANTLGVFAMVGSSLFTTQYLQMVMGARPLIAGLYALPSAGMAMLAAGLAPMLVRKVRPGLVVCAGLLVGASGFMLLSRLDMTGQSGLLIAGIMLMAGGVTLVLTVSSDLIIATAPPERAGSVAGLSQVATEFGGALGISLLGSIGTAVYRGHLAETGAPSAALDTLGGALESARHLTEPAATTLAAAAREAFTQGQHYAMLAAAAALCVMAVLAPVMLRAVRQAKGAPPPPEDRHAGRHAMR
ncbi:MFS transporter [Nonomuraea sp. NPDC001684]